MAGCGKQCGKIFLVSVNTLFLLLGVSLLGIGCAIKFKEDLLIENAEKLFEAVKLNEAKDIDLRQLLSSTAIVFIVAGAFATVVGFLGCAGACCEVKALLIIYSILVFLIIGAQVASVVLVVIMKSRVDKFLKDGMKDTLTDGYKGDKYDDGLSLAWNSIFLEFDCCGVDGYGDLTNSTSWNKTYNGQTLKTPITCCKDIQGTMPAYTVPTDLACAKSPTEANSNYKKGCYESIENFIRTYSTIFIAIGAAVLVFEILCIVFACCVCRNISDKEGNAV